MKCCICGPVRNCGPFLDKVLQNIEKIGELFEDYEILIYYDKSNDNSLTKLKEYTSKSYSYDYLKISYWKKIIEQDIQNKKTT